MYARAAAMYEGDMAEEPESRDRINGIPITEVLARIRAGEEAALGVLYDGLYEPLWRVALFMTRSPETAKEIVHDVFLAFWMRRATLDVGLDILVYLNASVRNRARNLRKHDLVVGRTEHVVIEEGDHALAMGQPAEATDALVEANEFHEAYQQILATLTERDRTVLLLRWEEGLTFEQIGQIFGLSNVGARGIVLRAQEKVQKALARYRG